MNKHPYLRAYMAGVGVPTVLLLVGITVFFSARFVFHIALPIEGVVIFPLMIIPNAFGLWNMLYLKLYPRWKTPIGLHGAVLPFLLGPIGFTLAVTLGFIRATEHGLVAFDVIHIPYWWLAVAPFVALPAYYLLWKLPVCFLN